ncbi:MAG: cytochrome c oxidase subunit II [Acidobacteriota bacterium]
MEFMGFPLFDFPIFPESASTLAGDVDAIYFFALAVSAVSSLLIAIILFGFFAVYKRKKKSEIGTPTAEPLALEIGWSLIPLVVTMVMFFWGAWVFLKAVNVPEDAIAYSATGKQWMWKFQHPTGQREINHLHVPLGEKIKLTMTSEDVIHSFFVPAFRVKQDVLPGRYTTVWFEATKTGTYHLFCTEYCGAEHARMIGSVVVMAPEDYQEWLDQMSQTMPPAMIGEQLFDQLACNSCHFDMDRGRGPALGGIAGERVELADGRTLDRDDDYLRMSILRPSEHLVDGYQRIMPTYQGQISETSLLQLIAYIKSLPAADDALIADDESEEPEDEDTTTDVVHNAAQLALETVAVTVGE